MATPLVWRWTRQRAYLKRLHAFLTGPQVMAFSCDLTVGSVDWAVSRRLLNLLASDSGMFTREIMAALDRLADLTDGIVDTDRCLLIRREVLRYGALSVHAVLIWVRLNRRCAIIVTLDDEFPLDAAYHVDNVLFETEVRHRRELAAKGGPQ